MRLWLQVALLVVVIVSPIVLGIRCRQGPPRPAKEIAWAVIPYFFLIVPCALLMNAQKPSIEWILPLLASLLLAVFCRSEKWYNLGWWTLMIVAIGLCLNFIHLITKDDYARDMKYVARIADTRFHITQAMGKEALEERFAPETVIGEAPVAAILREEGFFCPDFVTAEYEWHTPLTFLYHLKREKAILWYPGGDIKTGSQRLELRKATE